MALKIMVFCFALVSAPGWLCYAGDEPRTQPGEKQPADARRVFDRLLRDTRLTPAEKQHIEKLIADLGHDNWKVREQATKELCKLGLEAISLLYKAGESKDLEVAIRAKIALEKGDILLFPCLAPQL